MHEAAVVADERCAGLEQPHGLAQPGAAHEIDDAWPAHGLVAPGQAGVRAHLRGKLRRPRLAEQEHPLSGLRDDQAQQFGHARSGPGFRGSVGGPGADHPGGRTIAQRRGG